MLSAGKFIKACIYLFFGGYLASLVMLYLVQDNLIFPAPNAVVDNLPEGVQFSEMKTSDGQTLRHVRLKGDEGAPKIMFFHGNSSLAGYELERARVLQENGFDVLLVEYRGYGGSSGEPSAEAILKDGLETYDWYKSDENEWMFVYAHSLGTGVASYLTANRPIRSLALEAPYPALSDVAASKHPIFPVKTLLKHEIKTAEYLKDTQTPVLIIHGKKDRIIPIKFGQTLFESLDPSVVTMKVVENAGHNDLIENGSIDIVLGYFSKSF